MTGELSYSQLIERRNSTGLDHFRSQSRRDRDRVRYSRYFRRLSNVTQVAHSEESYLYHNRLTHSMKVAQVSAALAKIFLVREDEDEKYAVGNSLKESQLPNTDSLSTSFDPFAIEAAAHAHDIGHPPFGHAGKMTLDCLVEEKSKKTIGEKHGFEGNAQLFRVVTSLAQRNEDRGLNLTRATLNAMLKYPWERTSKKALDEDGRPNKWGYYTDPYTRDQEVFNWVRKGLGSFRDNKQVLEAQIMDYADDVTYAVHDLQDFFQSGLIPLDQLLREAIDEASGIDSEYKQYAASTRDELDQFEGYLEQKSDVDPNSFDVPEFFAMLSNWISQEKALLSPFKDTDAEIVALNEFSSNLVGRYLEANNSGSAKYVRLERLGDHYDLVVDEKFQNQVKTLKALTMYYVTSNPALMQQQHGQTTVLENLYSDLYSEAEKAQGARYPSSAIPSPYRERLKEAGGTSPPLYRSVADIITSLTEQQVFSLHKRLRGWTPGTLQDDIIG